MMTSEATLETLVTGYLERHGEPIPEAIGTDCLLEVGGRLLQVRLDAAGTLHVSTMVFWNDGDASRVLDEPIAEFNAFHLFAGGYCLLVEEQSLSLYVDQAVSIGRFDVAGFSAHLADFADRAVGCSRWYVGEVAEREAARETETA